MEKKCLVCGMKTEQFFCKEHNANKQLVHRFRNMSDEDQVKTLNKKAHELKLLKKTKDNPNLSITEVIKIVRKV